MHMNDDFQQWLEETPTNMDQWSLKGLEIGMKYLNLETAIISQIHNQVYVIQQAKSQLGDIFSAGDKFDLKDTYCEAVARTGKTITYIQVGAIPEMQLHPVYMAVQLESYIGAPIYDSQKSIIGTLNFSDHGVRQVKFTQDEIDFIEQMAGKFSEVFNQ